MSAVSPLVERGVELAASGDDAGAMEQWRAAISRDRGCVAAWQLLGEYELKHRHWREADTAFREVLRLKPDSPGADGRLAACLVHEGELDEAYDLVGRELSRNPDDPACLLLKGKIAQGKNLPADRMDALLRLQKLQPDDPEALGLLGAAYMESGKPAEARPLLERQVSLEPNNAAANARLGVVSFQTEPGPPGRAKAEAFLQKALAIAPDYAYAHVQLATVLLADGRAADAKSHLETAARLLPSKLQIWSMLTIAYHRVGDEAASARAAARANALTADEDRLNRLIARDLKDPGNFDKQMEIVRELFQRGDYKRSRYYLIRALHLRPADPQAQAILEKLRGLAEGPTASSEDG